MLGLFF
jgi:hypothetical protein